jgi:hypothetical protein
MRIQTPLVAVSIDAVPFGTVAGAMSPNGSCTATSFAKLAAVTLQRCWLKQFGVVHDGVTGPATRWPPPTTGFGRLPVSVLASMR